MKKYWGANRGLKNWNKMMSQLKIYERDYKRCALAVKDESLSPETRTLYQRHFNTLNQIIPSLRKSLCLDPES